MFINFSVPKFDYTDALNVDGLLTEEEKMMRDSFREYCQDKLMPRIVQANRNEGMQLVVSLSGGVLYVYIIIYNYYVSSI